MVVSVWNNAQGSNLDQKALLQYKSIKYSPAHLPQSDVICIKIFKEKVSLKKPDSVFVACLADDHGHRKTTLTG